MLFDLFSSRAGRRANLAVPLFFAASCFLGHGAERLFSKGPYIQAPGPGTVTIMWESLTNHEGTVRFGKHHALDRELGPVVPRRMTSRAGGSAAASKMKTFYLYRARLEGLDPGQSYSYTVELEGKSSPPCQFRPLDPHGRKVRFIAYGDSRSDPVKHSALAGRFLKYSPDFILHTGDLVARGKDYDLWSREFFEPMAEVIDRVPLFPVIGNHEQDGTNYAAFFDLPGSKLWYSFDAGPVHVLALDFHDENAASAQFEFAREDLLRSRAPWKIVCLHVPMYNIGGHSSTWGHKHFLPLFHQAKVDLVLTGHSHLYERFRPLAPGEAGSEWAITHITTGGGGAGLYNSPSHPALLAHARTNHFVVFDVSRNVLKGEAIAVDGTVLDRFRIRKSDGRIAPGYLAQRYTEQSLDLFCEFGGALRAGVTALPAPDQPVEVLFTIPAREHPASPADLQISLSADAAQDYILVGGPLGVTTPLAGSKRVWAKVQARPGRSITQTRSGELVPALSFQAEVRAGADCTLAYGPKCRISKAAQDSARQR